MSVIEGIGAPTRKTEAAIGDIYKDKTTGKQYKCVFAYQENFNDTFDCQWRDADGFDEVEETEVKTVTTQYNKNAK